jgi:Holliday junction resolvase RusA-like endonuclease
MISLSLPLPPSANNLWRVFRNRAIKSKEYREWIARAQSIVSESVGHLEPSTAPCVVKLQIYLRRRRDVDNNIKPVLDVLAGLVYANDSQVWMVAASRHMIVGDREPRVDVLVEETE